MLTFIHYNKEKDSKNISKLSDFLVQSKSLQYKSFENTVGKREIAHNMLFPLFQLCFLPCWSIFIKSEIVVCKLFQLGRV